MTPRHPESRIFAGASRTPDGVLKARLRLRSRQWARRAVARIHGDECKKLEVDLRALGMEPKRAMDQAIRDTAAAYRGEVVQLTQLRIQYPKRAGAVLIAMWRQEQEEKD